MGKARVAPLKAITVPRLELTAATLAVKVNKQLCIEWQLPINKAVLWTDSTIASILEEHFKKVSDFVANRLQLIHDSTTLSQWSHVPTDLNPADLASRGVHELETDWGQQQSCCFGLEDLSFYGRRKTRGQSNQLIYPR